MASSSLSAAEDPFALIERGNAMESSGNLWSAADLFGRVSVILRAEADGVAKEIVRIEAETSASASMKGKSMKGKSVTERAAVRSRKLGEKRKIASLYVEQSRSYLHKARRCLLRALEFETQEDERRCKELSRDEANVGPAGRRLKVLMERAEPLVGMLPKEEAARRRNIFGRIYAGGEEEEAEKEKAAQGKRVEKGKEAEEKKDDAHGSAADEDAEMEAALLEEMDAEFGADIPAAPGSEKVESDEDGLDIPAAPTMPTLPKKDAATDGLVLPPAPEDGAGHIERRSSTEAPASSSLGPLPPAAPTGQGAAGDPNSLEARLAQFNSSLPPGMKSQDERMKDIQKGLGRLGLSLPDSKASIGKVFRDHTDKSEEEQIKEIMDMAADEARMEGANVDDGTLAAAMAGGDRDASDEDDLVINDGDDLNAVLSKAGLTTSELRNEVGKMENLLGEDGMKVLRDIKENGELMTGRAKALSLVAAAQELLFEASTYLEKDEEDDTEEEMEDNEDEEEKELTATAATGEEEEGEEEEGEKEDKKEKEGVGKKAKKNKKESDALRKGRASLVGAREFLEQAIAALPK